MVDDIDICRTAKLYVDQHGDTAAIHAAMRADALLDAGHELNLSNLFAPPVDPGHRPWPPAGP